MSSPRTLPETRPRPLGSLVGVLALTASLLLGILGAAAPASPAQAAPLPSGPMTIEIHKYEQPETLGPPADGLPIADPSSIGTAPVAGATFAAIRVPGVDLSSDAGRREAAGMTAAEAAGRIADAGTAPSATAATDAAGHAVLDGLDIGLYYVEETGAPAGFADAAPFVVALPLTNPETGSDWLTTVHVYPKNARVDVSLAVDDRDAVTCGDAVTWTSRAAIPRMETIGAYRVQHLLADGLALAGALADVEVSIPGGPRLQRGADYTISETVIDGRAGFETVFTAAGRAKLVEARAGTPGAAVVTVYRGYATGPGEHTNEVRLLVDDSAPVTDTATTKFGPLQIRVSEKGHPEHLIPGAEFKLYLTPEDAIAGRNPVVVDGQDTWITDENGMIVIPCLRFSGFVNGLDREPDDELFRYSYAMPTSFPEGWTGEKRPLEAVVDSVVQPRLLEVEVWRSGNADATADAGVDAGGSDPDGAAGGTGGDPLPVTGGQLAGALILGALLVAGGSALALRRQRDGRSE